MHASQLNSTVLPWEQGSEFHLMEGVQKRKRFESPWDRDGLYFGTARDVIKAILTLGIASRGWKRLWIPAYFCQGVVRTMLETGIRVQWYQSWCPGKTGEPEGPCGVEGDVVLVVNHFGLNSRSSLEFEGNHAVAIIEDHTHDPWSPWAFNSNADYCLASLRKVLPVPDGGVLWSPKNQVLPKQPPLTEEHRLAAGEKLEAMKLKTLYLKGKIADKSMFRALSSSGELNLCGADVSSISRWSAEKLGEFPIPEWRDAKRKNHQALLEAMPSLKWVRVVSSSPETEVVPFSCILLFDCAKRREFVRLRLIRANIYPAVLWPLGEPAIQSIPQEYVDASERMLSIHCDMRYSTKDVLRVVDCICRFGQEFDA